MMLRNLPRICQQAYSCGCMQKAMGLASPVVSSRSGTSSQKEFTGMSRPLHTSPIVLVMDKDSVRGKKQVIKSSQDSKIEQPTDVDSDDEIDLVGLTEAGSILPTLETHSMMVGGVPYKELPIAHIKSSPNNTIIFITDHTGKGIANTSCGIEGFRNAKKSTNVAAQATGLSIGNVIMKKGVNHIRVVVKGIGAGRLSSIKGLQMAGLKIVSLTDNTPIKFNGPRPRKAKRL